MLKFLVEWMTGQSLQLFPLDGSFVLTLKVCSLFHLLDWCATDVSRHSRTQQRMVVSK